MQIFNHFRSNTISRGILIKTCPLEASPVMTTLRYVSLPVAKLFILFYGIVQTGQIVVGCQVKPHKNVAISHVSMHIFSQTRLVPAHRKADLIWLGQSQKRTVFSARGISSLLKPFYYFALSWRHALQPNPAIAPGFSEFWCNIFRNNAVSLGLQVLFNIVKVLCRDIFRNHD